LQERRATVPTGTAFGGDGPALGDFAECLKYAH